MLELSVIIPTLDRPGILSRTVAACAAQSLDPSCYEVIIVNDGSTGESRAKISELADPCGFTIINKPHSGLAASRNTGADAAKGEILLFLDDDVIPTEHAFKEHLASHKQRSVPVAVIGALPYPETIPMSPFFWYLLRSNHYDLYRDPDKYAGGAPPLPPLNGNASIRRDLFLDAGRYDESFRTYGGEDLEMGHRLRRRGVKFIYNPDAAGYHNHVKDFSRFLSDARSSGKALIRIYRKYPEIKSSKNIDILTDPWRGLNPRKKILKLIFTCTRVCPVLLFIPKLLIHLFGSRNRARHILFPCYRWIAHYEYASGMRDELKNEP